MRDWPDSWAGLPEDVPYGEQLVAEFEPFVTALASSTLAPATVRRHVDNLWALGGELVRRLNYDDELRDTPAANALDEEISMGEGPLVHDFTEAEQRSLDSTCRKLHAFRTRSHGNG